MKVKNLVSLIKEFSSKEVHENLKKFRRDIFYQGDNPETEKFLVEGGYISPHTTNVRCIGEKGIVKVNHYVWERKGMMFHRLKHPIQYILNRYAFS